MNNNETAPFGHCSAAMGCGWPAMDANDVPAHDAHDAGCVDVPTPVIEHVDADGRALSTEVAARFASRTYSHTVQESYGYTRHFTDGSTLYYSIGD